MSFNGSGTFLINSTGQPVVANTVISATVFNALTADLASGLTNCITKDGQSTPTANIPMGNNKITGLANGTLASDAANLGQVQSTAAKLITISGADTITGTMSPTLTAYAAGQLFYFVAAGANTGAVTLNVDGLGSRAVTRDGSSALAAGDINSGEMVVVIYDGTRFQMINAANSFGNTTINGTLTVTGKSNLAEVSTPSINASVAAVTTLTAAGASVTSANIGTAVVTTLTATGASVTSANVGTAVVTNLTATGASVASVNANVALLTTATVTNLTATGASIASANIGNLALSGISVASANFGVAVVTDLRVDGASITSANVGTAAITTGTVTNLTATGASVASANLGTAVITNGTVTTLTATSASVASVNAAVALVTTGTVTNLTSTAASIASANLGTAVITTLTATGASVASANVGVAATTTLTAVQASISSANLLTARFLGATSGYVGVQAATNAGSTTYTLPSADGTSGQVLSTNGTGTLSWTTAGGGGGTGDVVGPASSTDNAIARFDLTTGKLIQNSSVIVDDSGSITGVASLAAVTASITSANAGTATVTTGNLAFTGTAQRITGDFSNATVANRVMFQSSTTNATTFVGLIPNGTGTTSSINCFGVNDPTNASFLRLLQNGTSDSQIRSDITGTGSYVPMTFHTGGSERVRIDTSGNVGIGTGSPATSFGKSLHLYNDANTGTVASNTFLAIESVNRNANIDLSGWASATNAVSFSDTLGTTVAAMASSIADSNLLFRTGGTTERMRITSAGDVGIGTGTPAAKLDVNGTINDQYGYIRDVPQSGSNKTSAYTLSAGDAGRFVGVGTSGKIVIPNAVMAAGNVVTLYNATTGNVTVECSISIAYIAGTNTDKASVTLATRGVATVLFLDSNNCVITGNVS